ncbi:uncharacterized protein LOC107431868 [Ziziphus jujuba]|uniref:Uncharacterized protein LOC107431868 n=1 Tax=Ziziphus jujuba TaxID=326968 RepID=A0A6P4ASG1_ZIZJJ|nr:uncharacterized protein LOC107431868 [Ziziphus jujuba]
MKGTSKVIMGATLVMVVSLAMVLGLILVLLAELYCSLLLRRREHRITTTSNTNNPATPDAPSATETAINTSSPSYPTQPQDQSAGQPLSSFYSQGVLRAPRSFLFPAISCKEDSVETKKQHCQLDQVIDIPKQEPNLIPCRIGIVSTPSPSISFAASPQVTGEEKEEADGGSNITRDEKEEAGGGSNITRNEKSCGGGGVGEHFVYISNPIYDNDGTRFSGVNTPFETPDSSPSRLEMAGSSSGEDEVSQPSPSSPSSPLTPPLTPMKKLPAEASSISLRNARSLATSGSESNTNNGLSSSSSGSPCTSPSW